MTMQSSIDYDIDPVGRRIGRREVVYAGSPVEETVVDRRRWVYRDGLNPVAQLDAAGRLTQVYVYATRQHTPDYMIGLTWPADPTATTPTGTTLYRLVSDVRGSVRLVVDATTGTVAQQLTYDPYGQVLDDTAPGFQPFGYAGGEYDPRTGLTRFGARDYDSEVGRWTARDPIGFGGGDTNLYAYVGGDPVNSVDVTGLEVYHCWYAMDGWLSSFNHHMICTDSYPSQSGCMGYGPNQTTLEPDLRRGSNQAAIRCRSLPDVDEMCANEKMRTNNYGFYFPFTNDCFDAVERVINQCDSSAFRWTDGWEIPIGAWDW
jgi:RHS repeat-associated protein